VSLSDGTATWDDTQDLRGFDSIVASNYNDGTFNVTSGAFTGVVSITDGTASWTDSQLSGFTEITADSIVVNTTIYPAGGNIVNLGDVTNYWNLIWSDSVITNYISSTTITDGTMTSFGGAFSGVASITDGTASWTDSQDLTGFDTVSATYITDGTLNITTGNISSANLIGCDSLTANYVSGTEITDGTASLTTGSWSSINLLGADSITANYTSSTEITDGTATLTAGSLSSVNLIGADTVTATYFSGGQFYLAGDGTPTFFLTVITDTLCSVRTGIDTVRLHPPR
jgi:hypothetical protein